MARVRGADPLVGALGKHIAIAGFMGAGKSTVGAREAELTGRRFVDLDALIGVSAWLEGVLGRELPGQVYRAGAFAPVSGQSA